MAKDAASGGAAALAAVTALLALVTGFVVFAGATFKSAAEFDASPLNPANQPKLSWYEVRSNAAKPVKVSDIGLSGWASYVEVWGWVLGSDSYREWASRAAV